MKTTVVPILTGKSSARVIRVLREDGVRWIEKHGMPEEIEHETQILGWCAGRLPVPTVLEKRNGILKMSELPGETLMELEMERAVEIMARRGQPRCRVP